MYPDGRKEVVRGLDVVGTPLVSFNKILAAGDDDTLFNGSCGADSDAAGISVEKSDGRKDVIISSDRMQASQCDGLECEAVLALGSRAHDKNFEGAVPGNENDDIQLFMHKGVYAEFGGVSISAKESATAAVTVKNGVVGYMSDRDCIVKIDGRKFRLPASEYFVIIKKLF